MIPVKLTLNHITYEDFIRPDEMLIDFVRRHGYKSVKRGCDTSNCGACSVLVDGKLVLACSTPTYRCAGKNVETLENLLEITTALRHELANQGADQCGFCNPGILVATAALLRELEADPRPEMLTLEYVNNYLLGNLCRCTGYVSQSRGILRVLEQRYQELIKDGGRA